MSIQARLREERGSSALYFVIIVAAVLAVAGLVSDGASKAREARTVNLVSAEAARAGAQALGASALAGRPAHVDTARGSAAARSYLAAAGMSGDVSISGQSVTVTARTSWAPRLYSFVPAQNLTSTSTSSIQGR